MSPAASAIISILLAFLCLAATESFNRVISTSSENVTVDFSFFPIRSPNFGVLVQDDTGRFNPFAVSNPRTYLGTVRGYPGAMASGVLKANGVLLCRVSFESGIEWSSIGGVAVVRGNNNWKPQIPTSLVPPTAGDSVMFVPEVGVDAAYEEYIAAGSSIDDTIDMVEFSIMAANVPFVRDASILHRIGKIVVRSSQFKDPYGGSKNTGVLLKEVRNQWNSVISGIVGKTQHLALVVLPGAGGGLAWVGTVGTSSAYSANGASPNGEFSVIWRHEAGHNWGSGHSEGGGQPEGPTIMSGNKLSRFSSSELAKILKYKERVPQLASNISIPRPPRANMDIASIPLDRINVLANDLDANIQGLSIVSVKNPSALGSLVGISGGGITYGPSQGASLGVDSLSYTIENVQGRTASGYVMVRPDDLVAWWKMEERSGNTLQDFSGNAAKSSITGSTTWDQGLVFGGAGKVSLGTKPSLSGTTSFSISVWMKIPPSFNSTGVIIQQRSPSTSSTDGFNGGYMLSVSNGKPKFLVFGDGNYQFEFSSSTSINDGQWHHVVAMRDYTEGRIYVDGRLLGSANGQVRSLDGNIAVFMGWDGRDAASFLTGTLMATRIYRRALSLEEVRFLSTRPEALRGWWKMDEGSGLTLWDSSGNLANGDITGSTTWDQNGGLNFAGAGNVSLDTKPSLSGKISFSIHAWVKVPQNFTSKGIIIQQRSPKGFNGQYQLYVTSGKPRFMVFGNGALQFHFGTSDSVNDGQWHNIVAVRDQMEGRIYIDGKLSGSASGDVKNLDGSIAVYMGLDSRNANSFFTGSLKEVRIYNHVVVPQCPNNLILPEQQSILNILTSA